jgi:hypothetical protein
MAIFAKNALTQVSGFDNPIIAGELVWEQSTYWNLSITGNDNVTPIDLTGATIDAHIIRRAMSNITDTRNGLTFDIANYTPTPTPIELTITNRNDATGFFTLVINDSVWDLMNDDPELDINAQDCVGFSGRIKISFPAVGLTPQNDYIIFLLFLVRSDGIVVEG